MLNFLNGWKNPIIKVLTSRNIVLETIELPFAGKEGLKESIEELNVTHELNNFTTLKKVFGYRITWKLPYKEYANVSTMMKIKKILDYQRAGYKLVLIPRKDLPLRKFEILYTGKSLEYGIHGHGINAIGNKDVELEFQTKYLVEDLKFFDPNEIIYSGFYLYNRLGVLAV